jgi:uncharacterized membrane protein YfcA
MNPTLLFLLIGLLAGVMSGLFGIGGGIVIGPSLILLAGFIPVMATGTSLAALILPVGLLGAMEYYKRGHINVIAALWIALGLFIGAWFGAKLAQSLSGPTLQKSFAVFLFLVAIRVWWKA